MPIFQTMLQFLQAYVSYIFKDNMTQNSYKIFWYLFPSPNFPQDLPPTYQTSLSLCLCLFFTLEKNVKTKNI